MAAALLLKEFEEGREESFENFVLLQYEVGGCNLDCWTGE